MGFNGIYVGYPLVNCYITMERSTIFKGKIHYFYRPFSIAMLNYQRVPLAIYLLVPSKEWMGMRVAGISIDSYCGSFPRSLLSTSKFNIV